ncbi:MAG TPA: YolD-like family protein [Lentibacillus sp.]|uniref:YolD-like family protein n=1 Tax=Lentibacillus sp. TaxID=1925746 RepID=UPI002B4AD614|nr:YolD-like family protein [Lentibacillus sp.]HLR63111.1 YolD-like family protein [Lentibacillus sp.]
MPRDRGNIKWASLMLPEHTELLKEMWKEDEIKSKPELDEQQVELLNDQLLEALRRRSPICLRIYENGVMAEWTGTISKLDSQTNSVILETSVHSNKRIAFGDIFQIIFK